MQRDAPHGGIQAIADRKWHEYLTPHQNKRAESMGEDARDREHQHERKLSGMQDRRGGDVAYGG